MTEIQQIKSFLTKNGILYSNHHYEDDSLTIAYKIKANDYSICLTENDFTEEFSINYVNITNDVFAHKIVVEKNTGNASFIQSIANWRGDFEDKFQPLEKDYYIKLFLDKINDNINTNFLAEKLKHNFTISADKILNTDLVYKENIANFSKYENGGAYIASKAKMNKNILDRLYEYPKIMGWIKISSIKNYGYNSSTDLIEFIMSTTEFQNVNKNIKVNFPDYELQIFRRNNDLVLSVSKYSKQA